MKPVTGNTFPIKDQLKKLGGRWDAESKCWMVPEDKIREAQRLADSVPAPERMEGKKAAGTKKCAGCGKYYTEEEVGRNFGEWEDPCQSEKCYCGC